MPRFILVPLLAFGVIAGFGSGFHQLRQCRGEWREAEQERIAEICANAAAAQLKTVTQTPAAAPTVVNAGTAPAAQPPVSAPVQQISQAPAPIVIITGGNGSQPVQVIPAPARAPAAATPAK